MSSQHIPRTDPQCQELQGGYDSFSEGLVLTDGRHRIIGGEWVVEHGDKLANVTPINNKYGSVMRHDGQAVYGVRFWTTIEKTHLIVAQIAEQDAMRVARNVAKSEVKS